MMPHPRILLGAILLLTTAASAQAATFTVTNTNVGGEGSLRQAIIDANATAAADTINFAIDGIGTQTIGGSLPTISKPVTIDGYTQPQSSVNTATDATTNAVLRIRLDGSGIAAGDAILTISGGSTTIRGLILSGVKATGSAIFVTKAASNVSVLGCFIGTSPGGTADSTAGTGITIEGSANIGSALPEDRNLISGNDGPGVLLRGNQTKVRNNLIGTDKTGAPLLGNGVGVRMETAKAIGNSVGGQAPGEGNEIAGNLAEGILLTANVGDANHFERNRIHDNGALGIDIGADGVTPNDENDTDIGANNLQNYPELTFARIDGTRLRVQGLLRSTSGEHVIQFFSSSAPDPSGYGQGSNFIGELLVEIAEEESAVQFSAVLEQGVELTPPLFVTATDESASTRDSSEFSRAIEAIPGGTELTVVNTNDSGAGSLRAALEAANADPDPNTVVFNIPGLGAHTIQPSTPFTIEQGPLILDGYTQPGSVANKVAVGTDARLRIAIDGSQLDETDTMIDVVGTNAILRGLAIHSSPGDGIRTVGGSQLHVEGSFIGTDITGTVDLGNDGNGIHRGEASGSLLGGPARGHRNLISGNQQYGVLDAGAETTILNNIIGADATGLVALPNGIGGILAAGFDTVIGSDEAGLGNVLFGNGGSAIEVDTNAHGVAILGNSISGNDTLGIDLLGPGGVGGITANDADDDDAVGGNDLQNFPVLTAATVFASRLHVEGTLDVPAATNAATYTVRVFRNAGCDASGNGEGETLLGAVPVVLSGDDEEFSFDLPVTIEEGVSITATVTDTAIGNTSEFSTCLETAIEVPLCGDANEDDLVTATDALLVLKAAVGSLQCETCICDTNASGSITSPDALIVLKFAVGQDVVPTCPACA